MTMVSLDVLVHERIIKDTQTENDNELSIVELFHLYIEKLLTSNLVENELINSYLAKIN